MSEKTAKKRWKRITITIPRSLADRIKAEGDRVHAKFGPTVVRLAKDGLEEAEIRLSRERVQRVTAGQGL